MAWIKRNLYFVVGSLLALCLMVGAGFYTFTRWQRNSGEREKLNEAYSELKRLNNLNPHPGDGKKVDNIKLAREQTQELRKFLGKTTNTFVRIAPIPDSPKVAGSEFASALRLTIAQLQRDATNNSVVLPANYNYSFEAQRQQPFLVGNLDALAVQLGEVKAISDVLNQAKINSLLSIRRERVSTEDNSGPPTDYLDIHSETNELAVLTPYEISFQSFSTELADVISGFANSPHAILVKSVNVRPAATGMVLDPTTMTYAPSPATPTYITPTYIPQTPVPSAIPGRLPPGERSSRDMFNERYGIPSGGKDSMMSRYQQRYQPPPVAPVMIAPTAAAPRGGLQPMLDERQLDVTIMVQIVKLLPPKQERTN
jgi:hypothetical protein